MTILELIEVLQERHKRHGNLEVQSTWESTSRELRPEHIYKSRPGVAWLEKGETVLFIDADQNFYKAEYAEDPTEGEA